MAVQQLASLTLSDEACRTEVADDAAEDGAGAGSESPDRADLRGRRSEHGSGGQAGPGPGDGRQVAAAFCGAARGRAA